MSWEVPGVVVTLPASTGLKTQRFVTMSAGKVAKPSAGAPCVGVIYGAGTTNSTLDRYVSVQMTGVAQVYSAASTVAKGDWISATTAGEVRALSAGDVCLGCVVDGSSGSARILTVALVPIGTT